jgi:ATP:ADP antiporter, AAA family
MSESAALHHSEESKKNRRLKLLLMSAAFFFIIAAYTVAKELKDSVFVAIVGGKEYIPIAKLISIFIFIPLLMLYSKLVDSLKRYKLLSVYCWAYGTVGLLFAVLLTHPTIGLSNTNASPYRIFGWIFYYFIEGYTPFIVSVFWSFANSISSPVEAKENYGFMVSGSKLGGMIGPALALLLLRMTCMSGVYELSDATRHQVLLVFSSVCLLIAPLFIYLLMRRVSGRYMHGYEAVYKVEKKRKKTGEKTGFFSGFLMLIRVPYMFGIFCVGMCYELIHSVLSYQRVGIALKGALNMSDATGSLLKMAFFTQLAGFIISFFGTTWLLKRLGERWSLMLVPLSTTLLFLNFIFFQGQLSFLIFFVLNRAIYFAFVSPVREILYIPTVKDLKFKTKSWVDAFGTKFSKANGHLFNIFTHGLSATVFAVAQGIFFSLVLGVWFFVSWILGKRYEQAILSKEAIGAAAVAEEESPDK